MNCKNCGAKLYSKVFGKSNAILNDEQIELINYFKKEKSETYCQECGTEWVEENFELVKEEYENIKEKLIKLKTKLRKIINEIPVISTHSPKDWEYDILGMVTAQSTTGTGVISDFFSDFTDFFGSQSKTYNNKLKKGEDICFNNLKAQAFHLKGNAVIATDIDYAEVGGEKGMLMICMAGTAIHIKNTEELNLKNTGLGELRAVENEHNQSTKKYELLQVINSF